MKFKNCILKDCAHQLTPPSPIAYVINLSLKYALKTFVDLSKAFHTISHSSFLDKLSTYEIVVVLGPKLVQWLSIQWINESEFLLWNTL